MSKSKSRVVIIGGGASGVLAAWALSAAAAEVVLVDSSPGRGVAYGGSDPQHLLNTRAVNMSIQEGSPQHFVDWLNRTGAEGRRDWSGEDFAPRKVYGDYLEAHLRTLQAGGAVRLVGGTATAVRRQGDGWRVILAEGGGLDADAVVLATGNPRPRPLSIASGADLPAGVVIDDPWEESALAQVPPQGKVLLIGSGLTAVDVALTLLKRPGTVRVIAASRRGQLPRVHDLPPSVLPQLHRPFPSSARELYRRVRRLSEAVAGDDVRGRHAVFLGLRSVAPEIWSNLPPPERRRFLRHLRTWWEVERHRLAPQIQAIIAGAQEQQRFSVVRGRLARAEPAPAGARVTLRSGHREQQLEVTRIINCTGPDWRVENPTDPLLKSVIEAGGRPDDVRLGFAVDAFGELAGARGLFALGPLTRGAFFEITAVPEIRTRATRLAEHLAAATRSLAAV